MAVDRLKALEERTRYDPTEVEARVFSRWEEAGIFSPEPEGDPSENFSIAVPPPNVTGACTWATRSTRRSRTRASGWRACAGGAPSGSSAPTTRASPPSARSRSSSRARARAARRSAARRSSPRVAVARGVRRHDQAPVPGARRLARLRGRALHDGRRLRPGGHARVRAPLREGARLPRQLHGQLGPRAALGDLGPRGRAARRSRTRSTWSTTRSSPGSGSLTVATVRPETMLADTAIAVHPERRALLAAHRRDRDPAARRAPAADPRRRVRGPRVRHRRAQDHARPRPERLRDRPQARARRGHGDRRGRPDHGRRPRALPRAGGGRGARRRRRRAARGGPHLRHAAVRARRAALAPLGAAHRAAHLAAVVLRHERAGAARRSRSSRTGASASTRSAVDRASTWTGSRTSGPGASRASSGGATSCPVWYRGERDLRGREPARGRGLGARPGRARHLVLVRPVAVRDARLAATRRPSCARSIPPTCSRPRATSSSSGSPAW